MANTCKIKKDLNGLSIPVGETYISDMDAVYQYRWINDDERFEICADDEWHEACSIDFEF